MSHLEEYTDEELEELASTHVAKIRSLTGNYALIHAEGVNRRIESFLDSDVTLLKEDQRGSVAEHIKTLNAQELVEHVYRYKNMSTCLRITLEEIKKRLQGKECGSD